MAPPQPQGGPGEDLRRALDAQMQRTTADPLAALARVLGSPQPDPGLAGARRGRFVLERLLGLGGMGATYEAVDADAPATRVAVKVFGVLSAAQRERFDRERRILQALDHPGIVRYRDHGIGADGDAWLAMDLVAGQTLEAVLDEIAQKQLSGPAARALAGDGDAAGMRTRTLELLARVAQALAHAHDLGVVHRDLKPANLVIQADLTPVLVDFGLSRDLFEHVSLTRSGAMLGTLAYMAPEQLRGQADTADARTDIYAVGLLLYRCLLGQDLRQEHRDALRIRGFVLSRAQARQIPLPVQAILYRCLELRPARRYQDARQLAADLAAAARGDAVAARRPGVITRLDRGPLGPTCRGAAALLALIGAYVLWPAPHYLAVDAIHDDMRAVKLDGQTLGTPLQDHRIAPGEHVLEYGTHEAPLPLRLGFTIPKEHHFTRLNLLTVGTQSGRFHPFAEPQPYTGPDRAFVHVQEDQDDPTARLAIDGEPATSRRWQAVTPGRHRLTLAAEGLSETQDVELLPNQLSDLRLLWKGARAVLGSFRFTLGTVLAPLPHCVKLELGDGAVQFMHDVRDVAGVEARKDPQYIVLRTSLTPEVPDREVTAVLRVEFPEKMHSGAFWLQSEWAPQASCRIDYCTDDGPWRDPLEVALNNREGTCKGWFPIAVPAGGMRSFALRARMLVHQRPLGAPTLIHLHGYLDDPQADPPAFTLIADPDPHTVRVPR